MLVESYDDLSDWNRGNKIETKREKISNILLDLSSEQDNEQKMNIPSIQCLCYSFQFFHGTPDARLGYEVIKPRCLNTSTYFWTFSVRRVCQEYQIQMLNLFNGRSGRSLTKLPKVKELRLGGNCCLIRGMKI